MSADDENRFRPKPGRIRSDTPKAGKTKSFFTQVRKITRQHQAGAARIPSAPPSARPSSSHRSRAVVASGKGVKRGRGASFVRARNISGHWHHRQPGSRRVIVKQRSVRAAWKGGRARAHLRYVQRDGTSRDGERGQLYSGTEDSADGDAFLDRGKDDRHQFRFIVSPEDGAELSDLTAYTGNVNLSDVEVVDDLVTQFGTAFDSIVTAPAVTGVTINAGSTLPVANAGYDGTGALASGGTLIPDDRFEVTVTVRIDPNAPGAPAAPFENTATANGTAPGGTPVSDASNNGSDPTTGAGGPGAATPVMPPATSPQIGIAKQAGMRLARRGDVVPYTITVWSEAGNQVAIDVVDRLPPGFLYVPDSTRLEGNPVKEGPDCTVAEPCVEASGREVRFTNIALGGGDTLTLSLLVRVGASVQPGDHVNVATAFASGTDRPLSQSAQATVRVQAEHVFDCGEIIGKVFDDRNRNGYQDDEADEPGLPGVRLATVRGVLITTDRHGRFNVPCADIPDDIGSNFILKLDTRTLPTGYRLTTENPRVVRLTRGKLTKLNFGAAIDRVVRIDLSDAAFDAGSREAGAALQKGVRDLVSAIRKDPSVVRLTYYAAAGEERQAKERLEAVATLLRRAWKVDGGTYELGIETKIVLK